VSGGITAPLGFRAAGVACGIKPGALDLALVASDREAAAAAVFTTSRAAAAPILVSREHVSAGRARAVVVNSGCANAATGGRGLEAARAMAQRTAAALGCETGAVVVASTGVIGVHLPMERVLPGIDAAAAGLARDGGDAAARAILTTDTGPKQTAVEARVGGRPVRVGAMAKGAGMIAPNMATMLAFFTTDATIDPGLLQQALRRAVGESLNRISVDGDTSTNDMALVLASGAADAAPITDPGPDFEAFCAALQEASRQMAWAIVSTGEGVSRVAEVRVEGAATAADADRIARTVAESPLVKTALHGRDPNWGRVLAAAARSGVEIDVSRCEIRFGDVCVACAGEATEYDEAAARAALDETPARIGIRLSEGTASGWMWTSDLSREYVDINASYRS
jgi:glutamate N-acetyltransferase/amino-acid N-acetyltransferase